MVNRTGRAEAVCPIQPVFGVNICECTECGFVYSDFIHPRVLEFHYNHYSRRAMSEDDIADVRKQAKANGKSQIKTMVPYLPSSLGPVLDYGGAHGENAALFLHLSDKVYVAEHDPVCIEHIKSNPQLNLVMPDTLMDEDYIGFFDLVVLSNVLEHMTFPIRQMQYFSRIIAQDGLFFIEVPYESEFIKRAGRIVAQHVVFFSPETLRLLIERQGSFDIVDMRTCGPRLDDMVQAGRVLHDFDSQNTPDGWVIRALLRNSRPKLEAVDMNFDGPECDEILGDLSNVLLSHTFGSRFT